MIAELGAADFEAILAPLPGDQPTGVDLRLDYAPDAIYSSLRDARAAARAAERQADTEGGEEALPAFWRPVASLAITALKGHSKDLEVATLLTEALVRTSGLPGLTAGASVITGLVERHWDGLFPQPDEDGMEPRLQAVAGLSGQGADGVLMQPLRKTMLFPRSDGKPFAVWQYLATVDVDGVSDPERRAQLLAAFEEADDNARKAGAAFWSGQRDTITRALTAWREMDQVLKEKVGKQSPSTTRVRELLESMLRAAEKYAPKDEEPPALDAPVSMIGNADGAPASASSTLTGREQALRQLSEVAAWFKRNEPNSPIGYTLDEAARRARLSWPDLVAELVSNETTRHELLTSAGIKPTGDPPAA